MSIALPIQLVAGDTGSYPCKITGVRLNKGIFSIAIPLLDGYSYDSTNNVIKHNDETVFSFSAYENDFLVEFDNQKLFINNVIVSTTPDSTTHNLNFYLPSGLTKCFKPGKYTYDISVQKEESATETDDIIYTPIYTNAFNVFPKTNRIIVPVQVSS